VSTELVNGNAVGSITTASTRRSFSGGSAKAAEAPANVSPTTTATNTARRTMTRGASSIAAVREVVAWFVFIGSISWCVVMSDNSVRHVHHHWVARHHNRITTTKALVNVSP